jgi:hypothetical protein
MVLYSAFFPLVRAADALSVANARISSLEAKLEASRKAWDVVAAAKAAAEKSTKSATAKVKKAEKALADADRARAQREQAITNHLNQISALAGGKYRSFFLFGLLAHSSYLLVFDLLSLSLFFGFRRKYWGIFDAFAAERRSSDGCGEFAGVELDICPGNPRADSPRANADFCWVVAEEKGGCASC